MAKSTTKPKSAASKSGARASAGARKPSPAAKKAPIAPAAEDAIAAAASVTPVVSEFTTSVSGGELKKRILVDRVTKHGDLKKKNVKPVVDAVLAVLAEALANGEDLNLPPLGKVKINKQKSVSGGQVLMLKLRTSAPTEKDGKDKASREGKAEDEAEVDFDADDASEALADAAE